MFLNNDIAKGGEVIDYSPVSIEEYNSFLDYTIKRNKDEIVSCYNQEQAELLLKKLFENSNSIVQIIVGTYPPKLTEHLIEQKFLDNCVRNSRNIEILIAENNMKVSDYFHSFHRNNLMHCDVRKINDESMELLKGPKTYKDNHFMTCLLFDKNKYTLQIKANSFTSTANFNSKKTVTELGNKFDAAFKVADPF